MYCRQAIRSFPFLHDLLQVTLPASGGETRCYITDLQGKPVSGEYVLTGGSTHSLELESIPSGYYQLPQQCTGLLGFRTEHPALMHCILFTAGGQIIIGIFICR